jgi:hypothetical protein
VTRAALVHPHLGIGPAAHERAGRSGVVEVDVGEQDLRRLPVAELGEQRLDRRLGPRVDDRVLDLPASEHERDAEVVEIDVTHGRPPRPGS